jgi:pyruvate dehydrogenase E2 component (dihydrolipoamide acetyltransferase)
MVFEFKLPDVGEGIHEAEVLAIKVKEGDTVKEYQPMFDVETDKAVVEITSPVEGVVQKVFVKVGEMAKVGMVMISFNVSAESAPAATPAAGPAASSGTPAPAPTVAASLPAGAVKTASNNGHSPETKTEAPAIIPAPVVTPGGRTPVPAAPAARRLARELGVDLSLVRGSGPAGRVTREDIHAFAEGIPLTQTIPAGSRLPAAAQAPSETQALSQDEPAAGALSREPLSASAVELPDFSRFGKVDRIPLRSLRKRIAINMAQSWTHVPHVAHFDQIDITEMEAYRAKHEKAVAARGGKLTLTVITLKALASALKKYPQFNASLDENASEIIYKRYYNLGVAVATERGLIVPVIKDVDKKNLVDLSCELAEIAEKTRSGKIELERLQGGTFTVTNIGAIGGTGMMPMVNYPEVAIFGMARAKLQPVVREGQVVIRNILNVTLSFDHRVADGAEAALFVRHVIECLEDPFKLLLEV